MGDSLFEAILSECAYLSCRRGLTSVSPLEVCLTSHLPNKASDREANPSYWRVPLGGLAYCHTYLILLVWRGGWAIDRSTALGSTLVLLGALNFVEQCNFVVLFP